MIRSYLKRIVIVSFAVMVVAFAAAAVVVNSLSDGLPDLAALERIRPKLTSVVYSADGELLKTFSVQHRELVPYGELPESLIAALLSKEDRAFWDHWGVNLFGIMRAVVMAVVEREAPRATSTITQQLARDLFLTRDYSIVRKAKEAILAVRIEATYTKQEILQLYLNQVFWGGGSYGVQAAAKSYFGVDAKDLTVDQSATLVGLLPAPNRYNPLRFPDRARQQRNVVLGTMEAVNYLTPREADSLSALSMETKPGDEEELGTAPYFTEYVRLELAEKLERDDSLRIAFTRALGLPQNTGHHQLIYEGGLFIETTLDSRAQAIAERETQRWADTLQAYYDYAVQEWPDTSKGWKDETLSTEDSVVAKEIQVALLAIDVNKGGIIAMVGGRSFEESEFNRAVQMVRQPGSAFKPFVYTAAIDNGFTPVSRILDQPITVIDSIEGVVHEWRPQNYDLTVGGLTTLREGLRRSRNLVATRLLLRIGPRTAVRYARLMGLTTHLPAVQSAALGVGEVKLSELVPAYGVFPNNGIHTSAFAITRTSSLTGVDLIPKQISGKRRQVLSPETAYIVTTMLQTVMDRGTGGSARWKYRFYRPAGGKTGTTNDNGDAWFVGFTPQIACGVWVGFDQRASLARQHTGSGAALPIWAEFMKAVHDTLGLPTAEFEEPPGVVEVEVCTETYQIATPYCPEHYTEYFREGAVPGRCELHSPGSRRINRTQDDSRDRERERTRSGQSF